VRKSSSPRRRPRRARRTRTHAPRADAAARSPSPSLPSPAPLAALTLAARAPAARKPDEIYSHPPPFAPPPAADEPLFSDEFERASLSALLQTSTQTDLVPMRAADFERIDDNICTVRPPHRRSRPACSTHGPPPLAVRRPALPRQGQGRCHQLPHARRVLPVRPALPSAASSPRYEGADASFLRHAGTIKTSSTPTGTATTSRTTSATHGAARSSSRARSCTTRSSRPPPRRRRCAERRRRRAIRQVCARASRLLSCCQARESGAQCRAFCCREREADALAKEHRLTKRPGRGEIGMRCSK